MKIGFVVPTINVSKPSDIIKVAKVGEELGFHFGTFFDHIVTTRDSNGFFPYASDGNLPEASFQDRFEQLTTMAFVAAQTTRLELMTAILVVPHRPAVLAAKMLTTLDVLSGGRLVIGAAGGWSKPEFEAISAPPFDERGKVMDEYIDAYKALWTQESPCFSGQYTNFKNVSFEPKSIQKPHPPIWIGGESAPAQRRAARIGDGWYPSFGNAKAPLQSFQTYRAAQMHVAQLILDAGRSVDGFGWGLSVSSDFGPKMSPTFSDGNKTLFSGDHASILADLKTLRDEYNVSRVEFDFTGIGVEDALRRMEEFAEKVVSRL